LSAVCDIITGYDERDSTSCDLSPTKSYNLLSKEYSGLKVGYVSDAVLSNCTDYVIDKYKVDLAKMKAAGHKLVEIPIHYAEAWIPTYYIIATAEASSNLAKFDGVR